MCIIARMILGGLSSTHEPSALQGLCPSPSKSNISKLKSTPPASSSPELGSSKLQLDIR